MATSCPAVPDVPLQLASCLDGVRRGERRASERLVRLCEPLVRRLVRAHRPRAVAEDDLVQDVFVAVLTRLDRYQQRDGIPFDHWLSRLTINLCRDALRAERRRAVGPALSTEAVRWVASLITDPAPRMDEVLGARAAVEALLSELPAEDRLLLTLLSLEERSLEEVSALTGRSRTSLKVRAFRARRRLQQAARRLHSMPGERLDE
ncbi:MAG TPA: sigma-70 family RNA polymerase sigma factor [Myxococcaceae bacterium]|nr:sigma-70 family RNA polymerase sigma factor [Myxococcaceae bacterium]